MSLARWQKFILVPVLILVLLGPILAPFAESFNFPDRYDLVAILVEQGLYADANDYDGLLAPAAFDVAKVQRHLDAGVLVLKPTLHPTIAW